MTALFFCSFSVQKTVNCHGTDRRTQLYSLHFCNSYLPGQVFGIPEII